MKRTHLLLVNATLFFLIAACRDAGTENNNIGDTAATGQTNNRDGALVTRSEEYFVSNVIETNALGTAWLRSAINTGTDTALKSQARQMMDEHEQMDREIRAYANKKNISLEYIDTTTDVRLNERIGNEWDEEWADEVGDLHHRLIRRFERARDYVRDGELKIMVNKSLPILRTHRDMAEKLEARLDGRNQLLNK